MIRIENLNKTFNKQKVLFNLNLEFQKDKIYCLIGPNGSGKTTFVKCLLGLVIPDKDSKIYFEDKEIRYNLSQFFDVGYIPQFPLFPQNLKVKELIDYLLSFENYKNEINEKDLIIERFGIQTFYEKKISELSGGMKQKINILQCFMKKRNFYILDEPTASLDPYHSYLLKQIIKERKKNSYILYITHNLAEVEELADQMVVLIDGKLKLNEVPKQFIKMQNSTNLEEALSKIQEYTKI